MSFNRTKSPLYIVKYRTGNYPHHPPNLAQNFLPRNDRQSSIPVAISKKNPYGNPELILDLIEKVHENGLDYLTTELAAIVETISYFLR
jgi:hypothetical protein